jgi:hypothetical protein
VKWSQIIKIEPRLNDLYKEAKALKDNGSAVSFCANSEWYGWHNHHGFKQRLCSLVGWEAAHESLRTQDAYDIAYDKIYEALPNCRNCGCF